MENIKFAIDYLTKNSHKMLGDNNNYATQSVNLAIEALKKQIPKAVQTIDDNESYFVCSCGFTVGYFEDFREHKYCLNCGQKIDWEG